jgi:GNAT superfamily N-acetyltransferase
MPMLGELVLSFLEGYLRARDQEGSSLVRGDGIVQVHYRVPDGRPLELFCWKAPPDPGTLKLGMWLTLIGDEAIDGLGEARHSLHRLADEYLMEAQLPLRAAVAPGIRVNTLVDPNEIDTVNASGAFTPIPKAAARRGSAVFFRAMIDEVVAATARYGHAHPDLAIVDQVFTLPEFRRRGLAEALLARMGEQAARDGDKRMLLISSEQGRGLYERVGFRMVAPVAVFARD